MKCARCGHPIQWDEMFGWLHKDYGPKGASFSHMAEPPRRAPRSGAKEG